METKKELICIGCPMGCMVTAQLADGEIKSITGNTCPRGEAYVRKELTSPTRIVTSIVRIEGGELPVVSVKTAQDIPKDKIMDCIREIKKAMPKAPLSIGDIVVENAAGTGVDVIATKDVAAV